MFGRRHPLLDLSHDEYNLRHSLSIPSTFDSTMQAKSYLDLLSSGVFRLRGELLNIAEGYTPQGGTSMGPDWVTCYVQAASRSVDLGAHGYRLLGEKQALEVGMAAFWRALDNLASSHHIRIDRAIMAIQIQYILVFFTITTCRDICEILCDGFQDLFETAIGLAERYITSAPGYAESVGKRNLSLEPGVIPTIFLVCAKCRNRNLRARAIELLEVGCNREAMWDGRPFAAIMQHLSCLETSRAVAHSDIHPSVKDGRNRDQLNKLEYPEWARFCDVFVGDNFDAPGRASLFCARYRHESDAQIEIVEHKVKVDESTTGPWCQSKQGNTTTILE